MRLDISSSLETGEKTFQLTITEDELIRANFTIFDWLLFNDISNDPKASIADHLLGLETIARRIEEAYTPVVNV